LRSPRRKRLGSYHNIKHAVTKEKETRELSKHQTCAKAAYKATQILILIKWYFKKIDREDIRILYESFVSV